MNNYNFGIFNVLMLNNVSKRAKVTRIENKS